LQVALDVDADGCHGSRVGAAAWPGEWEAVRSAVTGVTPA
jgi:hypothetical protein